MAMLAEPRRRQRIGPNPRGKFFMEDEDNKGRALLQKLGWQTGNGLGRQNQGMSSPLVPKIQMDSKGLGYDVKNDPWVVHNEEFAQLLGTLEAVVPGNEGSSGDSKKSKAELESHAPEEEDSAGTRKLEKKSKSSRFRIHYHKFIKNKDVSNFSNTDLSCIFGQPTDILVNKTKRSKTVASSDDNEGGTSSPDTTTPSPEDPFDEDGVKTINCGSMSDYFNSKMKERDQKTKERAKEIQEEKELSVDDDGLKTVNRGSMIDYFKDMMAKRRAKADAESKGETHSVSLDINHDPDQNEQQEAEDNNGNESAPKKKTKNQIKINPEENQRQQQETEDNNGNESPPKKKTKNQIKINPDENQNQPQDANENSDNSESPPKKKSKGPRFDAGVEKNRVRELKRKVTDILETENDPRSSSAGDDNEDEIGQSKKSKKVKKGKKKSKRREPDDETERIVEHEGEIENQTSVEQLLEINKGLNFAKKEKRKNAKKRKLALEVENKEVETETTHEADNVASLMSEDQPEPSRKKAKKGKKNKKSKEHVSEETEEIPAPSDQLEANAEEPKKEIKSNKLDKFKNKHKNHGGQDYSRNSSKTKDKYKGRIDLVATGLGRTQAERKNNKMLMTGRDLRRLSQTFEGSNLHRIRGYAYY